jgi:RHS repeat-associated protein
MRNWAGHYNLAFHTDERCSVVAVSGSMVAYDSGPGMVQRIHTYDPYEREGSAAHLGRFGYASGIALPEAGLTHMRAREYDSALGRFLSADPIGTGVGVNLYAYAGGDPMNFVDLSGLDPNDLFSDGPCSICDGVATSDGVSITAPQDRTNEGYGPVDAAGLALVGGSGGVGGYGRGHGFQYYLENFGR